MNITIIHLSDLHIATKKATHMNNVNALIKSLRVLLPFEGIILAISGDIAAKGLPAEYKMASEFIGSIHKEIMSNFKIQSQNIKILLVPGNHDMNCNILPQCTRLECIEWHKKDKDGIIESEIQRELEKMKDFYDFAKKNNCYLDITSPFLSRKILPFEKADGSKEYIEANLINSCLFSNDDDKGIHYLPEEFFEAYSKEGRAIFSLSMMHHSPDWFIHKQKVRLIELIYKRSQLVLYGHEHYKVAQDIKISGEHGSIVQCGGAWWNKSFDNSSYFAGVLNLDTGAYKQYKFNWNIRGSFYEQSYEHTFDLSLNSTHRSEFLPSKGFVDTIVSDEKHIVCQDIRRYFVFPDIRIENSDDYKDTQSILSMSGLIELIESENELLIWGGAGSGKTTLARMLFLELCKDYTVLLCDMSDIAGKNQSNIIRNVFYNIYQDENYHLFQQQERAKKIVIIDGFNLIKSKHREKFLTDISDQFAHIVLIGERSKADDFDMRSRLQEELKQGKLKEVTIGRFFADKRNALIEKVIDILIENNSVLKKQLEIQIEGALELQGLEYQLDPDFIVKFTSFYSQNIQELHMSNTNVFNKIFEASIELAIRAHLRKETIGQIKTALGEVAHFIHFSKAYPILEAQIESLVKEYCKKYDETLSASRFLDIITQANILVREHEGLAYRFNNKNHLAYFVAEAVIRRFNDGDDNAEMELNEIIKYSCFSINPTILKFITYTSGNIRIVDLLLQQAKHYVEEWVEYDIENNQLKYLSSTPLLEQKLSSQPKKDEIKSKANREKVIDKEKSSRVEVIDIYDYNTDDVFKLNNQLIRALLQMNSISGCLVTFGHILPAMLKNDLIETLYKMPNQIFHRWSSVIDSSIDSFISEFAEHECDDGENIKTDPLEILDIMQRISINVLINLYYGVARNGASMATIEVLKRDKYVSTHNHELERLMFLEQTDQWSEFISKAADLYKNTKSGMTKTMITLMVHHLLIWSPTLPRDRRDHLIDTYNLQDNRRSILIKANQQ